MEVLDSFKVALSRIIGEAVKNEEQEKNSKVLSLNSKSFVLEQSIFTLLLKKDQWYSSTFSESSTR